MKCTRCEVELVRQDQEFCLRSSRLSQGRDGFEVDDYNLCEGCFEATLGDIIEGRNLNERKRNE